MDEVLDDDGACGKQVSLIKRRLALTWGRFIARKQLVARREASPKKSRGKEPLDEIQLAGERTHGEAAVDAWLAIEALNVGASSEWKSRCALLRFVESVTEGGCEMWKHAGMQEKGLPLLNDF